MRNCKILLRVQLLTAFGLNKLLHPADKKEYRRTLLMGCVFAFLFLVMAGYSTALSIGFSMMGMLAVLPPVMLTVSSMLTIILTFLKSNGILFGIKDYDMVMSLPVTNGQVIMSRLLTMYFMNFLAACVTMLPSVILYGIKAPASFSVWCMMLLSLFLAPLLPMVLAAALGAVITAVSIRFRYRNLVSIVLSMGAVLFLVGGSFGMQSMNTGDFAALGQMLGNMINRFYPPAALFSRALNEGSVGAFAMFALLTLGVTGIFVLLLSGFYGKINTAIFSHHTKSDFKMGAMAAATPFQAIYKKDLRRLFSSSIYTMNTTIGAVLLVMLSIVTLFMKPEQIEGIMGQAGLGFHLTDILPLLVSFFMVMSSTTCASISLEGKARWCLYSSPVPPITIFRAKLAVNLTILLPALLFSGILFVVHFRPGFLSGVFFFVTPAVYACYAAVMGLTLDLKYPRYDWSTEYQAVKQGIPVLGTIGTGMLLVFPPIMLTVVLPGFSALITPLFTLAIGCLVAVLYQKLKSIQSLGE